MDKKSDRGVALFLSILLHSVLAFFPLQEKPRPSAVSSTPIPISSISLVDASQLPTLRASESQPTPADWTPDDPIAETSDRPIDEPAPEATPDADLTLDEPIAETSDRPIDEPAPEAYPDTDLTPDAPSNKTRDRPIDKPAPKATPDPDPAPAPKPSPVPSTPTPVTPPDEAQIAADWKNLVGNLKDQDEGLGFTLFEIFDYFGEPGQVNRFFDENKQRKLDVSSFSHFPEQTPEQVFRDVVMPELTSNTGFAPQPQKNFSAGLAYRLLQGEMPRYLIVVKLREGEGSVLLLSESLPELEP